MIMDRRRFLGTAATVTSPFAAGCVRGGVGGLIGGDQYVPLIERHGGKAITYNHEQLRLRLGNSAVSVGGTIEFQVTNTTRSLIYLGCGNPWTIQKSVDGEWRDAIWTSAEGFGSCATPLPAGESTTENATISKAALESETEEVRVELSSGQYRLVLLSTDSYLAADFRIRS
jgi:hypothetical protein